MGVQWRKTAFIRRRRYQHERKHQRLRHGLRRVFILWGTVPELQRMSGARVSCADGLRVPDLRLCAGEKGLAELRAVPDLPSSLWQSTRDPSFTDEQFAANIAGRVENLRKRMTNRELADFVSAQLAPLPEVRRIPMMGGFIFYYRERIFGGIYGPGFMVKNVPAAWRFMPGTSAEPPYDGAKPMLHVLILADSAKLRAMVQAMWEELPERPPRKRKG